MAGLVSFKYTEKLDRTRTWAKRMEKLFRKGRFHIYGQAGVDALSAATPVDTGTTASSWYYTVSLTSEGLKIDWGNDNENQGVNIALILQYGHGTGTGGYVVGRDYINPAMQPVFDTILSDLIKEVGSW